MFATDSDIWSLPALLLAHQRGLKNRGSRVIFIVHGDMGPIEDLPNEVRAYLKLNLYLRSDDKDFTKKLRYAVESSDYP